MRKIAVTYGILLVVVCCGRVTGQDMQFSQSYANPLYLNPAFTGTAQASRAVLNYRKQWPGVAHEYNAYAASADFFLKDMRSGVGVSAIKDIAGINRLSNTVASAYYAKHLRVTRKSTVSLGVKGSYGMRAFDSGNLLFADQVINETPTSQSQPQINELTAYVDFGAGLLFYNERLWLGVSLHRINEPNQSLMGGEDLIPRKLSVHGGWVVPIREFERSLSEKKLRLAFQYKSQGDWDQLDVGGYFTLRNVNFGLWYRGLPTKSYRSGIANNESVVFLLGYEAPKRFSMGYSYDVSINGLFGHSGGAHEVSMIITVPHRKKTKRRVVPCAKF